MVPGRRGIAVRRWHDIRGLFGELEGVLGHVDAGTGIAVRGLRKGIPESSYEGSGQIFPLLPESDEVPHFLQVLWAFLKGGGGGHHGRQMRVPGSDKFVASLAGDGVVDHVTCDEEHV